MEKRPMVESENIATDSGRSHFRQDTKQALPRICALIFGNENDVLFIDRVNNRSIHDSTGDPATPSIRR